MNYRNDHVHSTLANMNIPRRYIPALHFDWLTPLYDPLMKWVFQELRFKRQLIEQAHLQRRQRVLDLGCGTGTLLLLIKQVHPEVEVVGLDVDPKVLEIARKKAVQAHADIALHQGVADQLPYLEHSFDCVFSSLVFHHLTTDHKQRALAEVFRILRPGGELHMADFGKPHNRLMSLISLIVRWFEEVSDNIKGLLPNLFQRAGFEAVEETAHYTTVAGTLSLYRANKPANPRK